MNKNKYMNVQHTVYNGEHGQSNNKFTSLQWIYLPSYESASL